MHNAYYCRLVGLFDSIYGFMWLTDIPTVYFGRKEWWGSSGAKLAHVNVKTALLVQLCCWVGPVHTERGWFTSPETPLS